MWTLSHGMWDLPRLGIKPVSPALTGGFFTTEPPGKLQFPFRLCIRDGGQVSHRPQPKPGRAMTIAAAELATGRRGAFKLVGSQPLFDRPLRLRPT